MNAFRTCALPIAGLALFFLCAVTSAQPEDTGAQETPDIAALRAKAEQGDAEAQFKLGVMYYGGRGAPQDYTEALKWNRKAAEQGFAAAQFNLGVMYAEGRGVPQGYAEAVKWFRLAAEQGYAAAQFNLGIMYAKGQGVPQDFVSAHLWSNLATAAGNTDAMKNRDIVAGLMTPEQIAEAQRLAREWQEQHAKPTATP